MASYRHLCVYYIYNPLRCKDGYFPKKEPAINLAEESANRSLSSIHATRSAERVPPHLFSIPREDYKIILAKCSAFYSFILCVYYTKLEPTFRTNDVARSACVVV